MLQLHQVIPHNQYIFFIYNIIFYTEEVSFYTISKLQYSFYKFKKWKFFHNCIILKYYDLLKRSF